MSFSVKIQGTVKLAERLKRDVKRIEASLKKAGRELEREITARTLSGRDVNDQAFEPYSEGYRKHKEKLGLYAGHPDIHLTGETLGGITTTVRREGDTTITLEVSIEGEAALKKAGHVSKRRKFFGLSKAQKKRIRETINAIFRRK